MGGSIFTKSLGHKLIMSVSGLFLMLFLLVHLSMNLTLLMDGVTWLGRTWGEGELFNVGCHFMISNPLIRLVEPLLAVGFVVHILYASIITLRNRKSRPVGYSVVGGNHLTSWASKNMFILGAMLLAFLVLHIYNYFWQFRFGHMESILVDGVEMENCYPVVAGLFIESKLYCLIYVAGSVLLGLHLSHGFWSAFQTLGWNNVRWVERLRIISRILGIFFAVGFSSIPLYFMLFK